MTQTHSAPVDGDLSLADINNAVALEEGNFGPLLGLMQTGENENTATFEVLDAGAPLLTADEKIVLSESSTPTAPSGRAVVFFAPVRVAGTTRKVVGHRKA